MGETIWKFTLVGDRAGIYANMPGRAHILSAGVSGSNVVVWAIVDPAAPLVRRRFYVAPTGRDLPDEPQRLLINRVEVNAPSGLLIFHVFDLGAASLLRADDTDTGPQ